MTSSSLNLYIIQCIILITGPFVLVTQVQSLPAPGGSSFGGVFRLPRCSLAHLNYIICLFKEFWNLSSCVICKLHAALTAPPSMPSLNTAQPPKTDLTKAERRWSTLSDTSPSLTVGRRDPEEPLWIATLFPKLTSKHQVYNQKLPRFFNYLKTQLICKFVLRGD